MEYSSLWMESIWDFYLKIYFNGVVVQLVRTPACHAGSHEFETRQYRTSLYSSIGRAADL